MLNLLKENFYKMGWDIVCAVIEEKKKHGIEELSRVAEQGSGDVSYNIDVKPDKIVESYFRKISEKVPIIGISEKTGTNTYGKKPEYFVIVDPIDGSRHIAVDDISAHTLIGIGKLKNSGEPTLGDIELSMQFEIPTSRQYIMDVITAEKGKGAKIEGFKKIETQNKTGFEKIYSTKPTPSKADGIEHGFFVFTDFFRPTTNIAQVRDYAFEKVLGPVKKGKADVFNFQCISNGGQFYRILTGKDRGVADLRPIQEELLKREGKALGLCAHPYDVCTALALKEAGTIITDGFGSEKGFWNNPCDTKTNVHFIVYANEKIRKKMEPAIQEAIEKVWGIKV